ncbi:MAG: biosynthetic peptidoglycan transglycosylase [Pseudomonadota bacterium]|nr:biosynthetic peptidoglycan transglycosylase [Pseudomonadota bacterium]
MILGALAVGVAATPTAARWALERRDVHVEGMGWCAEGLCLTGITRGEARAAGAVVRWDRVVRVVGVVVPLDAITEQVGGDAADAAGLGGTLPGLLTALLVAVDVEGIVIEGAPIPSLSGRVWPTRHLVGEGVEVIDRTVHATVPTDVGTLELQATPTAGAVAIDAWCRACRIPPPSEADATLTLPDAHAVGVWANGAFTGTVAIGGVEVGVVARREDARVTGRLTLPVTPIADVYALFAPIVPELATARIGGTVRAEADVTWPGGVTRIDPVIEGFTVDGLVADGASGGLAGGTFSFRARDAAGEQVLVTTGEGSRGWVPLELLGPWLPAAVIATEDAGFREHRGYDLVGMREAAAKNAEEGTVVRGGSTLTQQLAKNLFLDGTRSYARKLRELLYAVEMERELGKRRILELYLNVVEFGPGLRGAHAGADTYFLKAPAGLLPEEAAWLASILRFPRTAWRKQYLAERPDDQRVDWILSNLRGVPEEARLAAIGRPVRLVPPP